MTIGLSVHQAQGSFEEQRALLHEVHALLEDGIGRLKLLEFEELEAFLEQRASLLAEVRRQSSLGWRTDHLGGEELRNLSAEIRSQEGRLRVLLEELLPEARALAAKARRNANLARRYKR